MNLFGIKIRLHPTFIWLLLFALFAGGVGAVAWILVVFTLVVLHELSHSLVARAHGIHVRDITLLPIGGVARLGEMPEDPATEFRIALAGPALNFLLAAGIYLFALATDARLSTTVEAATRSGLVEFRSLTLLGLILRANLILGAFNLLPAFPMDGGRLLRAYLAGKHGHLRATEMAARTGRWIAGVMVLYALARLVSGSAGELWLALIAAFIYVSGKQEEAAVKLRHAHRGFWRLFGFGEEPSYGRREGRADEPPEFSRGRGDVIDVNGHVREKDEGSASDAFRKLTEEIKSHIAD